MIQNFSIKDKDNVKTKIQFVFYQFWVKRKINEKYYNFNFNTTDQTKLNLG